MYILTSLHTWITDLGHVKENDNLSQSPVLLYVKRTCKESEWGMRLTLTLTFEADWHLLRWPNLNFRCTVALNAHGVSIVYSVSFRSRREFEPRSAIHVCVCVYIYIYIYIYTGAGHIIRISSKSWFISLIPFKKWNLYNVYIHSTQTDIFQVFISLILMIISDN